jgi:hypothetical protein
LSRSAWAGLERQYIVCARNGTPVSSAARAMPTAETFSFSSNSSEYWE